MASSYKTAAQPGTTARRSLARGEDPLIINTHLEPVATPPRRKSNRDTLMTEAQTISTQSPFASPVSSNFQGRGLKPRPPSFPFGDGAPPIDEFTNRRNKRRDARRQNRALEENLAPTEAPEAPDIPPMAPEPPRAPPVSYRAPFAESRQGHAQTLPPRNHATPDRELSPASAQVAAEYYRSGGIETPINGEEIHVAEEMPIQATNGRPILHEVGPERKASAATTRSRKTSTGHPEQARLREWAPDRSPLQRLELTLDSITKEEKRARVEEAELRAKEAKAGRGGDKYASNAKRERRAARVRNEQAQPDPRTLPEAGLVRSLSRHQREELQRSTTLEAQKPSPIDARGFDYQPSQDVQQQQSDSADDHANASQTEEVNVQHNANPKQGSYNDDEDESWMYQRSPAEIQYAEALEASHEKPTHLKSPHAQMAAPSRVKQPYEEKEVVANHQSPAMRPARRNSDNTLPIRRGSTRKIEQLTGQRPPQQLATSGSVRTDRNARKASQSSATPLSSPEHTDPTAQIGNQPSERQTAEQQYYLNMLQRRSTRGAFDDGIYVAGPRLDEWKQGGVARLYDDVLDLGEAVELESDKNHAWWEAEHGAGGRRRSSTKSRAEAYAGEYADSNGTCTL